MRAGTTFGLTAAQLAQTVFVAGASGASDDIYMQISDGEAVSSLGNFHVNVVNHAPVLTVADVHAVVPGQWLEATSLIGATDADHDALTYNFYRQQPGGQQRSFRGQRHGDAGGKHFRPDRCTT